VNTERFSRIFDVLDLLVASPEGLRLTEVSQALGAPVSSTHNLLQTMVAAEVVTVREDLRYSVGPRAVRVAVRIVNSLQVRSAARRHLQSLAERLGNDVYLAVRVGDRVVYVDRFRGSEPVSVNIRLGDSLALHATAVGKLFAAHEPDLRAVVLRRSRRALTPATITAADELQAEFERIRRSGVSVSREEAYEGIVGIAAPVRDVAGALAAAVHVSALRAGLSEPREREIVEHTAATAAAIESDLGTPEPAGEPGPPTARRIPPSRP
jgi:DNA-binding IclR family transcriptional regulator